MGNKNSGNWKHLPTFHPVKIGKSQERFTHERVLQAEQLAEYKKRAMGSHRKWDYETICERMYALEEYLNETLEKDEPITVAGMQLAMAIPEKQFRQIRNGEKDHTLEEFLDEHEVNDETLMESNGLLFYKLEDGKVIPLEQPSALLKRAYLRMQEQAEKRLYSKSGKVTDIFTMKSVFGWEDQPTTVNDNRTQILQITTEEAREAIKMLK